jgi:hypothetical protein
MLGAVDQSLHVQEEQPHLHPGAPVHEGLPQLQALASALASVSLVSVMI